MLTAREIADSYKLSREDRELAEAVVAEFRELSSKPKEREKAGGPPTPDELLPSRSEVIQRHASDPDKVLGIEQYFLSLLREAR